jgi:outer membrane protein
MNKNFWTYALLATVVGNAAAATDGVWTLKDCIDYAIAHNIQLQKTRAAEQTADIENKQARAGLLPSLNASVAQGLTYRPFQETGGNYVNGGIASSASNKATESGSYGVNASWTVWDGGRKRYNIQSSEMNIQSAELATEVQANSISEQITQLYVQILYMQEAVKVNEKLLSQDSIVCARGEQMLAYGQMSQADLAQLQAQVSSGRYDVVNAKTQIDNYKMQLRQLLKIEHDEDIEIAYVDVTDEQVLAAIPAKADAYAAALESRPEIKSSQLAVDQSRLATKTARAAYYPSVSMTGGLGDSHVSGGQNNFFNQMKTNFNANLGVSVAIPIYDNRQTKSAVEKAQVQEVTSSLDLIDAQDNLYTTMENYWLQATNNRAKYIAAKDNVASMQASYDLLQEQFRLGLKNIADLLSSRKNLLTAEQSLLQDKYTAVLNRTLLDFYSNGTISL